MSDETESKISSKEESTAASVKTASNISEEKNATFGSTVVKRDAIDPCEDSGFSTISTISCSNQSGILYNIVNRSKIH